MRGRWVGLVLAALTLVVFRSALDPGRVFFERDVAVYIYPQVEAWVRAVGEGAWPTWSPSFGFGAPLWEDPGYQIAYPPTWLNLLVSQPTYYKIFVLGHCWFAAFGLYVFFRALPLPAGPSLVGSLVWAFSGPFLSAANLNHHFASAAWIGWVLAALVRLVERPSWSRALLLGGSAALLAIAGSADVAMLTAFLGLCLVLGRTDSILRDRRRMGFLAAAVVFAALVASVQWLPTMAFVAGMPTRTSLPTHDTLYWSLHPLSAVDLLVPSLVADLPWAPAERTALFESRAPFLESIYLGVSTLALVLLALVGRRDRTTRACALAFGVLLLLAFGRHLPGLEDLLSSRGIAVPFRYPVKALIGAAVAWAALAASGLDLWLASWSDAIRRRAAAVGVVVSVAALAVAVWVFAGLPSVLRPRFDTRLASDLLQDAVGDASFRVWTAAALALATGLSLLWRSRSEVPRPGATLILSAIVLGDLVHAGSAVNAMAPAALLFERPQILDRLDRPLARQRVQALGVEDEAARPYQAGGPPGWELEWSLTFAQYEWLIAPSGARWGIGGAYDGDFNGLTPAPLPEMQTILVKGEERLRRRLLQLGAVNYVTGIFARPPSVTSGLSPIAAVPSLYGAPVSLYRVAETLPRAYMVGRSRVVPETSAALRQVLDPAFDPASEVVLAGGRALAPAGSFQGAAHVVRRQANRLAVDVESSGEGYLVLVEAYARSWRATVDGRPAEVVRANAAFRAVAVPAGSHRVELTYFPTAIVWGLILSGGASTGALAWALWSRRRSSSA